MTLLAAHGQGTGNAKSSATSPLETLVDDATGDAQTPSLDGNPKWPTDRRTRGQTGYVVSRQDLLSQMGAPPGIQGKKSPYVFAYKQMMRRQGAVHLKPYLDQAIWRQGMDEVIAQAMRSRITGELVYLAQLGERDRRKYIEPATAWDAIGTMPHQGAVLYIDDARCLDAAEFQDRVPIPKVEPPKKSFSTLELGGSWQQVAAVYNLELLLGRQFTDKLRNETKLFREGSLFVISRKRIVGLQTALWKLQGYLDAHTTIP